LRFYKKMDDKYQNKHRVSSARLLGWDYGSHGLYFVTICTKDRLRYFGEIDVSGTQNTASIQMTIIGRTAFDNWMLIPEYHPYVQLDEFIIMPDHVHGILFINKPDKINWESNKFGAQRNNLASIIRGYKSSVKQYAAINNIEFSWQPRYYDRVIRNEKEYIGIREYIYNNPDNWLFSKDNFENLFIP
jgi:putative transposase